MGKKMRNEMNSVIKYVISAHTQYIYICTYICAVKFNYT